MVQTFKRQRKDSFDKNNWVDWGVVKITQDDADTLNASSHHTKVRYVLEKKQVKPKAQK